MTVSWCGTAVVPQPTQQRRRCDAPTADCPPTSFPLSPAHDAAVCTCVGWVRLGTQGLLSPVLAVLVSVLSYEVELNHTTLNKRTSLLLQGQHTTTNTIILTAIPGDVHVTPQPQCQRQQTWCATSALSDCMQITQPD